MEVAVIVVEGRTKFNPESVEICLMTSSKPDETERHASEGPLFSEFKDCSIVLIFNQTVYWMKDIAAKALDTVSVFQI